MPSMELSLDGTGLICASSGSRTTGGSVDPIQMRLRPARRSTSERRSSVSSRHAIASYTFSTSVTAGITSVQSRNTASTRTKHWGRCQTVPCRTSAGANSPTSTVVDSPTTISSRLCPPILGVGTSHPSSRGGVQVPTAIRNDHDTDEDGVLAERSGTPTIDCAAQSRSGIAEGRSDGHPPAAMTRTARFSTGPTRARARGPRAGPVE